MMIESQDTTQKFVTANQPVLASWPKLLPAHVSSIQCLVQHLGGLRSAWQLPHLAHAPIKGKIQKHFSQIMFFSSGTSFSLSSNFLIGQFH